MLNDAALELDTTDLNRQVTHALMVGRLLRGVTWVRGWRETLMGRDVLEV